MVLASDWFLDAWSDLWQIPVSAALMLIVVIGVVRTIGLRAFSKMSSFDFAVTVSIGSILGGVATSSVAVANGALATASLLAVQAVVAWIRARQGRAEQLLDNTPVLLMDGPVFLQHNLRATRVTKGDVSLPNSVKRTCSGLRTSVRSCSRPPETSACSTAITTLIH